MKKLILSMALTLSFSALADMEHKAGQGDAPPAKKISLAHGCFNEIDNLGCGHPKDDLGFFKGCLDENRENLSPSCQSFFGRLYGKKE